MSQLKNFQKLNTTSNDDHCFIYNFKKLDKIQVSYTRSIADRQCNNIYFKREVNRFPKKENPLKVQMYVL